MGCDYYIQKLLLIYFSDNEYLGMELEREKVYFGKINLDEDEDDYEQKYNEYIKDVLTPKMEPIIIYDNNSFNKLLSKEKYKTL